VTFGLYVRLVVDIVLIVFLGPQLHYWSTVGRSLKCPFFLHPNISAVDDGIGCFLGRVESACYQLSSYKSQALLEQPTISHSSEQVCTAVLQKLTRRQEHSELCCRNA
jgi:hypothetical protein